MLLIRNWVLPAASTVMFALLGLAILGLPGISLIQTLDGRPVPGGILAEQASAIIAEGNA
ncbi:hypothetical protein [Mesorhizobium sp. RIZ17]|uniref:hypothetical protein n=1 Tax=Mesorhizobium sp. RIZ17 TaxID=3132743 RepID=UPI003DA9C244